MNPTSPLSRNKKSQNKKKLRYWEGWFHYSSPAPPESAARQYADNYDGCFFFGWERSGEDEEGW